MILTTTRRRKHKENWITNESPMLRTNLAKKPPQVGPLTVLYGVYAWTMFLLLGLVALPPLIVLPSLGTRRRLVRALARLALCALGMRLRTNGMAQLPHPSVVVANHGSYLDGVVLMAALPPHFSFVIKREMAGVPLAGTLLRRIGSQFVERRDRGRSAVDARRLLRSARDGEALVFFPEGTFGKNAGLLRFHIGAFAAAHRAQLPLVPLVIRGTRACLPPGGFLPRRGPIDVQVLPVLQRPASSHDPAAALRDLARAQILGELGGPDSLDAVASAAAQDRP